MDADEIRLHSQKHIEDHGYGQYMICAIAHTEGTNVWEVDAEAGVEELTLIIDNDDGSLIDFKKSKNFKRSAVESVSITDNANVSLGMYFELKSKQYFDVKRTNLQSIEVDCNDGFIKSFKINVLNPNKSDYVKAYRLANNFVNYLSIVTGTVIEHKRPLIKLNGAQIQPLSITIDAAQNHVLDESFLEHMLEPDSNVLYYFKMGHVAFQNNSFDQAIGWFYKIIENDTSLSKHYQPLRNAVDHEKLTKNQAETRVELKRSFDLDLDKDGYLDFTSPDVQFKLYNSCCDLHKIVKPKVTQTVTKFISTK